jgi:hypothetical protein
MKKSLFHLAVVTLLGASVASCSGAPKEQVKAVEPAAVARSAGAAVQLSASVEAVDVSNRLITLKGPRGNVGVYKVGEQVKRLSEIRAGDTITAEYKVAAVAELREPTAEEKNAPLAVVTGAGRAGSEAPPAAGIGRIVRAVTTIEALDRPAQNLTVKGPLEGIVSVHVDDAATFGHLHIGQTIVVTFGETLTLSVEPRAKNP